MQQQKKIPMRARDYLAKLNMEVLFRAAMVIDQMCNSKFESQGGVLVIMTFCPNNKGVNDVVTVPMGELDGYMAFAANAAMEKCYRLHSRRYDERRKEDVRASKSADPGLGRYAGAVVAFDMNYKGKLLHMVDGDDTEVIFAFAGLDPTADEELCIAIARRFDNLTLPDYRERIVSDDTGDNLMGKVLLSQD